MTLENLSNKFTLNEKGDYEYQTAVFNGSGIQITMEKKGDIFIYAFLDGMQPKLVARELDTDNAIFELGLPEGFYVRIITTTKPQAKMAIYG